MSSKLDQAQIFQDIHDDSTDSIKVQQVGSLINVAYDAITRVDIDAETEAFQYRVGGVSGTIVTTVTVTYTDSTKEFISSVVRTE